MYCGCKMILFSTGMKANLVTRLISLKSNNGNILYYNSLELFLVQDGAPPYWRTILRDWLIDNLLVSDQYGLIAETLTLLDPMILGLNRVIFFLWSQVKKKYMVESIKVLKKMCLKPFSNCRNKNKNLTTGI